jgi:predicted RecA/RadA family phage recombinase
MAANFIQPGVSIEITLGADAVSGEARELAADGLVGVFSADGLSGEKVTMHIEGVFELPRDAADTFAVGDKVYWNETAGEVTTDALETFMGFATEAGGPSAGNIKVKLLGNVPA